MNSERSLALGLLLLAAPARADWQAARPDHRWSFPADHAPHPGYKTEWWYFTGHLVSAAAPARRFSYQFTVFRIGLSSAPVTGASRWTGRQLLMGHAALTDLSAGTHHFSDVLYRESPLLAQFGPGHPLLAASPSPAGSAGRWALSWNGTGFDFTARDDAQDFAFDLKTLPLKPLVLEGPHGFSRKSSTGDSASLYYSFTRLKTAGSVSVAGSSFAVTGESWMDKEFGSGQLAADQVGWDWFSLQFDDRTELMLYELRDKNGARSFAFGTAVDRGGRTRFLEAGEFKITVLDRWRSPGTGGVYPSRWRIEVPSLRRAFLLTPRLADQENRGRRLKKMAYWEGSVDVTAADAGAALGQGFVELTGYAPGSASETAGPLR